MTLNLQIDSKIKIVAPGASNFGAEGVVYGKKDGNWRVEIKEKSGDECYRFGAWWIEAGMEKMSQD